MTSVLPGSGRASPVLDDDVDLVRDRALVERAQAGDRAAFDDLYQRYARRLYRFCLRRLHDPHEAEDVAQEAFARAWRALPSFGGDRRFYPWLSVIASHLCTDVLRRRARSTPVAEFHQANVASVEDGGEELALAAADAQMVARAFGSLSERHQRVLHLREAMGWSYQRIADHEGVGITAVETLLWRARQALKREFAAVAGGERFGLLGGLLSLGWLRRLLQAPAGAARRLQALPVSAWVPTAAVGAAAVATVGVLAAPAASSPPPRPTAAPAVAASPGAGAPASSSPVTAAATPPSASSSPSPADTATAPVGSPADTPTSTTAATLAPADDGLLAPVGATVAPALAGAADDVDGLLQPTGTSLDDTAGAAAAAGAGLAGAASADLCPALGTVDGLLGTPATRCPGP